MGDVVERLAGDLGRYVPGAMAAGGVPGVALGIVVDGRPAVVQGYGVRRMGEPDPVTDGTVFTIASCTKAFTAAAVGVLVDDGRLGWDDRVIDHLPGFQLYDPYVTREITVRDLLCHRSGLPRGDLLWAGSGYGLAEIVRRLRYLKPVAGFRARYGYQNILFDVAGEVIRNASGRPWDRFVQERLLGPLAMGSSRAGIPALTGATDVARPHGKVEDAVRPIPPFADVYSSSAGSIDSTAADMARWVAFQVGDGAWGDHRILKGETLAETHTPHTIIRPDPGESYLRSLGLEPRFEAYALGWALFEHRGSRVVAHGGNIDGFTTEVAMVPDEGVGVVVLANLDATTLPLAVCLRVLDLARGLPVRDWAADFLAREGEARRKAAAERALLRSNRAVGTKPSLPLPGYTGDYDDPCYGRIHISLEADRLVLRFGVSWFGDLEHWHHDVFRASWRGPTQGDSLVTFHLGAEGNVEDLQTGILESQEPTAFRRVLV